MSKRNPFIAISDNAPLSRAILRLNNTGAHRLATMNSAGELSDLLSQSEIVRYLSDHLDELEFTKSTVEELSLGYRKVVTVPMNKSAFYAFEQIVRNQVSGIGITNEDGEIVANLSASDLKVICFKCIHSFSL